MAESPEAADERRRRWTSDVAHELRNPLQNLTGHLESAQDGLMEPDDAWFDSVIDEVSQLRHLVEDLKILTLTDSGTFRLETSTVDLGELATDVIAAHCYRGDQNRIVLTATGSAAADVDELRIRQVLGNLVDNALRHTPAGGAASILVRAVEVAVEIAVSDTGEGIPAETLDRIFGPEMSAMTVSISAAQPSGATTLPGAVTAPFMLCSTTNRPWCGHRTTSGM